MELKLKTLLIKKYNDIPERLSGLSEAHFPIFLKEDIQENFAPAWDEEPMYGRVDSIARYSSTKRTVSFSFYVLALKPGNPPDGVPRRNDVFDKDGLTSLAVSSLRGGRLPSKDYVMGKGKDQLNNMKTKLFNTRTVSEYHMFDDQDTCVNKVEFLRSLTYPKFDNSVYTQPPMIYVSLSNQFLDVKGYITDLSITHQVVSGLGIDLEDTLFTPHGWEVSISITILHSAPPTTEGLVF